MFDLRTMRTKVYGISQLPSLSNTLSSPPFHEAQTHAELASYVKKGRVPTLPPQYGHYLQSAIKAMMSLEVNKRTRVCKTVSCASYSPQKGHLQPIYWLTSA